MANECYSNYTVIGSKKEIKELYGIFQKVLSQGYTMGGDMLYGNLYSLINELGGNTACIYYRANFYGLKLIDDNTFQFNSDSAWRPSLEFLEFITIKFPTLNYFFISTDAEAGFISITNDVNKLYYSYGNEYEVWDKTKIQANLPKTFYECVTIKASNDNIVTSYDERDIWF